MGAEITTGTTATTGIRNAHGGDCQLYWALSRHLNSSGLKTIQHAERSIAQIAEDMHQEEVGARGFVNEMPCKEDSLKHERPIMWLTMIAGFIILAILSLAAGGTLIASILSMGEAMPVGYWQGTGYMFIWLSWVPLGAGLWRGYIDLYPRAWFRWWWTLKDQPREAIDVDELIDYLDNHLKAENFSIFSSVKSSRDQKLQDRLSYLREALEKADKLKDAETAYSDVHAQLSDRVEALEKQVAAIHKKKQEAKEIAANLTSGRLGQYQELVKQVDVLLNSLYHKQSGETGSITRKIRSKRKESAEKLADDIRKIPALLKEADDLASTALAEDSKYDTEESPGKEIGIETVV